MENIFSRICIIVAVFGGSILSACEQLPSTRLTVKVQDEEGESIPDAIVWTSGKFRTKSNNNGEAIVKFRTDMKVPVGAFKDGYYQSGGMSVYPYDKAFDASKPVVIKLKKFKNPIPMYAKSWNHGVSTGLQIPGRVGEQVGYDFMVGDWVKPYGKGILADIYFKRSGDWNYPLGEKYEQKIHITFPSTHDGLISFILPLSGQSELRSGYQAPINGYQNSWLQARSRKPGEYIKSNRKGERNFYIRIRTQVDEEGNIVSCHYGKIYGDFMSLIYYLNPTPNDRNVEFDPKRNLFKDQQIDRP